MTTQTAATFPALTGEVVTEAHSTVCATRGHASYKIADVEQGWCPRCGETTAPAEVDPELVAKFDRMIHLAARIAEFKMSKAFATSDHRWVQYDKALKVEQAEETALWGSLSLTELAAFGEYRKTH